MMRMAYYLCDVFPKSYNYSLILRKTSDKYQLRDFLQNTSPVLPTTVKGIKSGESLRKFDMGTFEKG